MSNLPKQKNWADVLGIIGLVLGIVNIITTFLGLIPLLGLPLRILSTFGGAITLILGILACVFGKGGKGKGIAAIVLGVIGVGVSLPLWIVYITAAVH